MAACQGPATKEMYWPKLGKLFHVFVGQLHKGLQASVHVLYLYTLYEVM